MSVAPALILALGAAVAEEEAVFQFTALHRALLKQMVVVWDPTEAGAPSIDPSAPYGSRAPWKDVQRVARESAGRKLSSSEARRLHHESGAALSALLEHGTLKPGRYTLEDPLFGRRSPFEGLALVDGAESEIAGKLVVHPPHARGRTIQVDLGAEQVRVLRALSVAWREWSEEEPEWIDGPTIDSKRPYGNAGFYFVEMADALGLQPARTRTEDDHGFSPEQLRRMDRLHHEMDVVLQVFLRHADVPLGSYPLRDWLVPEGK